MLKPKWRKSTFSDTTNCVEVADLGAGSIGVRDSKDLSGPVLYFTTGEAQAFIQGTKAGEFDDLA